MHAIIGAKKLSHYNTVALEPHMTTATSFMFAERTHHLVIEFNTVLRSVGNRNQPVAPMYF